MVYKQHTSGVKRSGTSKRLLKKESKQGDRTVMTPVTPRSLPSSKDIDPNFTPGSCSLGYIPVYGIGMRTLLDFQADKVKKFLRDHWNHLSLAKIGKENAWYECVEENTRRLQLKLDLKEWRRKDMRPRPFKHGLGKLLL